MNKYIINLKKVNKLYKSKSSKPTVIEFFKNINAKKIHALKNIDLKIKRGEKIGIIGKNGSGKTTLLKTIADITTPSSGSMKVNGKIVSLIGLGAGFNMELSGRENIILSGMLLGMKKAEVEENIEKIIEYSEIEEFIDEPIYTYSDGMKLRLGISISVYSRPDIFLIDEGYNVGDKDFQNKIRTDTDKIFNKDRTVLMVSHNLHTFFDYCDRIIVMDKGKIVFDGGLEGIKFYYKDFRWNYISPSARKKLVEANKKWSEIKTNQSKSR